jgi:flagellar hook-associated protein 3 FlgL
MSFTDFRITQRSIADRSLANLERNLARVSDLQDQVSSLKRIRKPSDDPVGTVSALEYRAQVGRRDQIDRNLDDARAWLGATDNALQGVVEKLNRARDLGIQGRNGSLGQPERAALAAEVDQLREGVLNLANSTYLDRPIFAGNARTTAAYDASGAYLGDSGVVARTIAPGERLTVNTSGPATFGAPGASVFDALSALSAALRTDPSQIDAAMSTLDASTQNVLGALADVGARGQRVDDMKTRNGTVTDDLKKSLSDVEDVDVTKALVELNVQQVAYQSALSATAKAIQVSLVDFLR